MTDAIFENITASAKALDSAIDAAMQVVSKARNLATTTPNEKTRAACEEMNAALHASLGALSDTSLGVACERFQAPYLPKEVPTTLNDIGRVSHETWQRVKAARQALDRASEVLPGLPDPVRLALWEKAGVKSRLTREGRQVATLAKTMPGPARAMFEATPDPVKSFGVADFDVLLSLA